MEPLAKLFGTVARVRLMRLFLCNPERVFLTREVRLKSQIAPNAARREMARLHTAGMIQRRKRGKQSGWVLNANFEYLEPLKAMLLNNQSFRHDTIARRLKPAGRVKALVVTGMFTGNEHSKIDVLLVGDKLKRRIITSALRAIEAETGKEVRYAALEMANFRYRRDMRDRFLRDIFEYSHEVLVDKVGIRI